MEGSRAGGRRAGGGRARRCIGDVADTSEIYREDIGDIADICGAAGARLPAEVEYGGAGQDVVVRHRVRHRRVVPPQPLRRPAGSGPLRSGSGPPA